MSSRFSRRTVSRELPLSGKITFMLITGTQRDQYMAAQLRFRAAMLKAADLSEDEMRLKSAKEQEEVFKRTMMSSPDIMLLFNQKQYELLSWCVMGEDGITPEWKTPEEAEAALDYETATELATAASEVNKLTPETHKKEQLDFFDQARGDNGTLSPVQCPGPTSPS